MILLPCSACADDRSDGRLDADCVQTPVQRNHATERLTRLRNTLQWRSLLLNARKTRSTRTLAQVAELVDALGSGPSGGNTVEVRVLSWAPDVGKRHLRVAFSFYAETVF